MPHVHTRVFPSHASEGARLLLDAVAALQQVQRELAFTHGGWSEPTTDDEGGLCLSVRLPDQDPEAMIRELRTVLGLSKWLSLREPTWWVQVWDDLSLVEATFGRPLALLGGVAVDEAGTYDDELETRLAETVAKVPLPGVDLGFPPGVPAEVLRAMDEGPTDPERVDPAFVGAVVAAVDRCAKLRRPSAAEALAVVLDEVHDDVLRPLVVDGWAEHAPAVRARLRGILERAEDRAAARDLALELLFSVPKGQALDDAAAALVPWAEDPELIATLAGVVEDEEVPQGPGTRVEGACADLLLRTTAGARAVARRARRDREGEPLTWWAVRKLLAAGVPDCAVPTVRLYARPGAPLPAWLAEEMRSAGLTAPAPSELQTLPAEEDALLDLAR